MATPRQKNTAWKYTMNGGPGDEVVISGVAGRFAKSNNMKEFAENLYGKKKLTSEHTRYNARQENIPPALGVTNGIKKFDPVFFGVSYKQVVVMDPMSRILLESTFEALLDAGINPQSLRGENVGVYIGCCFSQREKYYKEDNDSGLGLVGCSRSVFANRISFFLDIHGPSLSVDTACSSSMTAVDIAYRAIKDGECDSAIVGGCNLCTEAVITRMFHQLGVLTTSDACYCFDERASGYVRGEAIGVLILQRAKDAKRVYATIVHCKSNNDGYKSMGLTYPSHISQFSLLKQIYEECDVSPHEISFLEAHATATKVGDPEELKAIDNFYSPGRTRPLKIGSVKSNAGHAEGASAICSLAKVLIAMENGAIPPNINYEKPREDFDCLIKGRLQVVTEPTPLEEGYVGVNSYGFGGANAHIILKANPKQKRDKHSEGNDLPKLVLASGRSREAVASFLDDVENRPMDVEYIRLLHDIFAENIPGYLYRGYTIAHLETSGHSIRATEEYDGEAKPVWFIFSGMGSQWPGMGTSLMQIPVFAQTIHKCDRVLKPRGIDIVDILTNTDKHNFDNILRSFVGITAVQIGLVDILRAVGIVPDKIIGHSLGELGCAYADGCLTAEEAILAAYSRGLASIEAELIPGSMAAVGLGYNQMKDLCPGDIEVACHNGPDSSTISGPKKSMEAFIVQLQAKGIFVKEVPCGNIAYHSKYIAPAGKKLLSYLQDLLKDPKPRSGKWLSTSVPRKEWSTPTWKLSSAEYHTNNFLSPVLFEEVAALIPKNAITIEIAPHGLLQAILKRAVDPSVQHIPLTKRGHEDNAVMVLQALGKLYNVGLQPQLAKLYPEVELPVSRGTPMISPLVKWDHSEDWDYLGENQETTGVTVKNFSISSSNYLGKSMTGHVINGRHLVPATAYLTLVWSACSTQKDGQNLPILFEDVMFNRATIIPEKGNLELTVVFQESTNTFHIVESDEAIVTGTLRVLTNSSQEQMPAEYLSEPDDMPEEMDTKDIYKKLRLQGYNYSGMFQGIKSSTITGSKGHIAWNNNWISFLDAMLQMQILRHPARELFVPTRIKKLLIDIPAHEKTLQKTSTTDVSLPVTFYENLQTIVCGGVLIQNVTVTSIPMRAPSEIPVLEEYKFVAHRDFSDVTLFEAISLSMNLVLENISSLHVQTVEFIDEHDNLNTESLVSPVIMQVCDNMPKVRSTHLLISRSNRFQENSLPVNIEVIEPNEIPQNTKATVAFGHDLLSNDRLENLKRLIQLVEQNGFLASFENGNYSTQHAENFELDIIMEKRVNQQRIVLLKKRIQSPKNIVTIHLKNNEFSWIEDVKKFLRDSEKYSSAENLRLVLVGEGFDNGLLGFVNCLRREPNGKAVRGILVQDTNAPKFSLDHPFYRNQLQLDLAINVLQRNVWGTYRHLPLPSIEPKLVSYGSVMQKVRGDLKSFTWVEGPLEEISSRDNFVYVYYSAINFRDVMVATGKLQNVISKVMLSNTLERYIPTTGFEYSGIDKAGNRVMGVHYDRAFANMRPCSELLTYSVPDKWTLEEAATIPCAYMTCYYAFYVVGQIKRGHKILIHSGSGAVGQAAINVALSEGCEIFTTVGTPEKRKFIKETFPTIDDNHISNSRDTSFELMVLEQTGGQGVDIVLNSLAADKLHASVRCLATNGQFLEIGKYDMMGDTKLGMSHFLKGITFRPVFLDVLIGMDGEDARAIAYLLKDGVKKGVVKPLVRTVFEKEQMEAAVRYMTAGKHIGKVMIKFRNEGDPLNTPFLAYPQYYSKRDGVYVIFGGLGGFGLELADWLIHRGAKNLVLVSRTGVKNGYQRMRINFWELRRIKVVVVTGKDVTKTEEVESILRTAEKLGQIDGIFNLVASLVDALCTNQTKESFEESFKGKAWLTEILDKLTRKTCPYLRHFVVFSSVSCGRGNPGQTNYGMSNSVMERICEKRVQDGLPGLALEWGAIGDVGLVADMQVDGKELVIEGTLQQGITSCLEVLNDFLLRDCAIVSSMVVAEKFRGKISRNVVEAIQSIMGLKHLKGINMLTTLPELGVDSMTVVEIKETLEREFDIFLTAQQIRALNFAKLSEMSKVSAKCNAAEKDAPRNDVNTFNIEYFGKMIGSEQEYSKVCVELPTKAEANRAKIYFIPGIEGCNVVFKTLAKHIKSPAMCLQVDISIEGRSHLHIKEIANSLLPYILSSNEGRKDFMIVGYSYGTLIAIEIARKMESMGFLGRLILIDGSPELLKLMYPSMLTDDHVENENRFITYTMNNLFSRGNLIPKAELLKCTTWEEKLNMAMHSFNNVRHNGSVSGEITKKVYDIIYKRIIALKNYDTSNEKPIKSSITLLRSTQSHVVSLEEDCGLSKVTEGTVKVHYVEGNHLTMLENIKIVQVINDETVNNTTI